MKFITIITRTLKSGKTYEDYRKAWFHKNGFGMPTTMYTILNVFNPREIISIGIQDAQLENLTSLLETDVKDRLAQPLDEIIESTITRTFGVVAAVDDFSPSGVLPYVEPSVDGQIIHYENLISAFSVVKQHIKDAGLKRDSLKKQLLSDD
jgi:hypothetical protein